MGESYLMSRLTEEARSAPTAAMANPEAQDMLVVHQAR
jgi:hypothetical protein